MLRVMMFAVILAAAAGRAATPSYAPNVFFKDGASSSGWIDFKAYKASNIFSPAKVNGRDVMVALYGGPTNLDRSFVASVGLSETPGGNQALLQDFCLA
jgi:hypothetical protein